jgi:hypothetical protein
VHLAIFGRSLRRIFRMAVMGCRIKFFSHNQPSICRACDLTPRYFSGLCCRSSGMTDLLLFGIVSLPWSPLASLPPDVDVPLPLLFGAIPVVSEEPFELAELAAGRGVPGPPGLLWANASGPDTRRTTAIVTAASFMVGLPLQNLTEANCKDAALFQLPTYPNCPFGVSTRRRGTLARLPNCLWCLRDDAMEPIKGPWTEQDNERLLEMVGRGASAFRASAALKRSVPSVRGRARKLGSPFPSIRESRKASNAKAEESSP